jgi:hypothetical protein
MHRLEEILHLLCTRLDDTGIGYDENDEPQEEGDQTS